MASRILYKPAAAALVACPPGPRRGPRLQQHSRRPEAQGELRHSAALDPEKHKQDLLAKQQAGKGHWKPELASDSEEAVKADRHDGAARSTKEDVEELQRQTKATAEETSKKGTSMRDGL